MSVETLKQLDGGPLLDRTFADVPKEALADTGVVRLDRHHGSSSPLNWSDLLRSDRILIISQAGSGKTYECRQCQFRLWEEGQPAFFIELAELAANKIEDLLSPDEMERLEQWRISESSVATFFLDSVDELKLTHGSFRTALTRLAKAIGGRLGRARIVITSRPVPFDRHQVEAILPVPPIPHRQLTGVDFADAAMGVAKKEPDGDQPPPMRTVEMLPLSDSQIKVFATGQGVSNSEALLADIYRRSAIEFAERPQDLIELCSAWRDDQRVSSYRSQIANDIAIKLKPRTDRRELSELSPIRAFEGASRLALAAMLMRRLTFRHSPADAGEQPGTAIDPADILNDWTAEERATLLERPLFGFASYGRVRFHHRSVLEHLAAERLHRHLACGKPIAAVKRLLFAETAQRERVVRPAMRPVAAWLALGNGSIFAEVCARDPTVLLDFGDPDALSLGQKAQALSAYVGRYGNGGWRGLRVPDIQVRRFATPGLAPLLRKLWPTVDNAEVRSLLLDLIGAGRISECADLAFAVAQSEMEPVQQRIGALDALIEIDDPRLQEIANSLETDPALWTSQAAKPAVIRLFPSYIGVGGLIGILSRLTDEHHSAGYLAYQLPKRIATMGGNLTEVGPLVAGLSGLVGDGIAWSPVWPHYESARPFLLPALAAACARQMSCGPLTSGLAQSIALALRLVGNRDEADEHVKTLRQYVDAAGPEAREMLFWAEDDFRQSKRPLADHVARLWEAARHGPISLDPQRDSAWVGAVLQDEARPVTERAMMLDAALDQVWDGRGTLGEHAAQLRFQVSNCPVLVAMVDQRLKPVLVDDEHKALKASWNRQEKRRERQRAEDHASWLDFWTEIASKPEEVFASARSEKTVWNLWRAMSQFGQESQVSGWDRRFLEGHFGSALANRMRDALRPVWRKDKPTLWSERAPGKRNTYYTRWQLGLAALAAEAEDRAWATKLTAAEARLACRYAPIQLNGLPSWLDDVTISFPKEVDEVLGGELTTELQEMAGIESSGLITTIIHCSPTLKGLFHPRLHTWLKQRGDLSREGEDGTAAVARLQTVLDMLVANTNPAIGQFLRERALTRLEDGINNPAAAIWLSVLLRLDPEASTAILERILEHALVARNGLGVALFATLFGDLRSMWSSAVSGPIFTPTLLLRLVTLAYQHVRIDDDIRHVGAFTPNVRDQAERARDALLGAILRTKGADGWAAKLTLAEEPSFVHMRDRVIQVARELAAEEVDGDPATAAAVINLDCHWEMPPATRDDMFQLMHDRLDDLNDLLLQDISPRELWAGISEERLMRREIARQMKVAANHLYCVDQEAVTADEKETDIRFRSTASCQEGVIELKIGEKPRSAADLRQALANQLVRKYMAAEDCRAGCLLITVATPRRWEHPDTGEMLDLGGLITMLNQDAHRIMESLGGVLRVSARGLDLMPRIASERAAKAAGSP